jgi:hypothetical protein
MAIFGGFFRPQTVDGIMANFTRTIDDLGTLENDLLAQNVRYADEIKALENRRRANKQEADRAFDVRLALQKIINPPKPADPSF